MDEKRLQELKEYIELIAEVERLQDIERKALEQSADVQHNWLSPIEAEGWKAEIERLQNALLQATDEASYESKRYEDARKENERLQSELTWYHHERDRLLREAQ